MLPRSEASYCQGVFGSFIQVQNTSLRFSQNYLGIAWGIFKAEKLSEQYRVWLKGREHSQELARKFILKASRKKPLVSVTMPDGTIRLVDSHHTFYALSLFMQSLGINHFNVHVAMKDFYNQPRADGSLWKPKDVIKDMREKNYLNILDQKWVKPEDLNAIPSSIFALRDSPERSLLSSAFQSIIFHREIKTNKQGEEHSAFNRLKGSDFTPQTNN